MNTPDAFSANDGWALRTGIDLGLAAIHAGPLPCPADDLLTVDFDALETYCFSCGSYLWRTAGVRWVWWHIEGYLGVTNDGALRYPVHVGACLKRLEHICSDDEHISLKKARRPASAVVRGIDTSTRQRIVSGIYALADPKTGKVRYIGKSRNIVQRYNKHCSLRGHNNQQKRWWVYTLRQKNELPRLLILEECDHDFDERERYWIHAYREKGEADLNIALTSNNG